MPANDRVVLDSLIRAAAPTYGSDRTPDEALELFVFDQVLKQYSLPLDALEAGWVDGASDGGLDGFFVFIDDQPLTETVEAADVRRGAALSVHVFSVRHKDHFQELPVNALHASLGELFNFELNNDSLRYNFSEDILEIRQSLRETFINIAVKHPTVAIHIHYACRGDTSGINTSVRGRLEQTATNVKSLFSAATVTHDFLGAAELVELARRRRPNSLRLRFVESLTSDQGTNYVLLVRLRDYFRFLSDAEGNLERSLFESNVRDYVGDSGINNDIARTLKEGTSGQPDFWWLNNGVTMLASQAFPAAGKELVIERPQIVNGLQTTDVIHRHFAKLPGEDVLRDERTLLIKVIASSNEEIRDQIIKATNFQNPVAFASLRATDPVQRNIETFLQDHNWFYDRRPGHYKVLGKPTERIISTAYLGGAVWALLYGELGKAHRTKWMRIEEPYRKVFNDRIPLPAYLTAVALTRSSATRLRQVVGPRGGEHSRSTAEQLIAFVVANSRLPWREGDVDRLTKLPIHDVTDSEWEQVWSWIEKRVAEYKERRGYVEPAPPTKIIVRSRKFVTFAVSALKQELP